MAGSIKQADGSLDYSAYLDWAKEHGGGIFHYPLSIKSLPGNERGVVAEAAVEKDSIVFSIPYENLMDYKRVVGTPLAPIISGAEDLREEDLLAWLLLYEKNKGEASRWAGHLAVLPGEYHGVLSFTEEELEELRGSNLHGLAVALRAQVARDFEEFSARRRPPAATAAGAAAAAGPSVAEVSAPWFTLEAYKWALCTIWSRFVTVAVRGEQLKVMAPVFDMFNHDPKAQVMHGFQDANDCLHIVTFQDWAAGQEVSINYGPLPNRRLLHLYGFVEEGNPLDSVELWATMSPDCPDYQIKKQVLDQYLVDPERLLLPATPHVRLPAAARPQDEPFLLTRGGDLPPALLAALRVQRARGAAELARAHRAFADGAPLSLRNEEEVLQTLGQAIQGMIDAYPTSADDDRALLLREEASNIHNTDDSDNSRRRKRMAVIMRLGEKEVLAAAARRAAARRAWARRAGRGAAAVALLPPGGVQRGTVGNLIKRIEQQGIKLCGLRMMSADKVLKNDPRFEKDVGDDNGPCVAALLSGRDCLHQIKSIVDTLNDELSLTDKSKCYASDSDIDALTEISQFFLSCDEEPNTVLSEWELHSNPWLVEQADDDGEVESKI